jgi:hypothetical protein
MRKRVAAFILLGSLGLLAGILAACGGGSSSNTGPSAGGGGGFSGSSGAVVQGQLRRGAGSAEGEPVIYVVFRTALGIGLAEAATSPLAGATVTLSGPGGTFTKTTDADGKFSFGDLVAGTYTFSVCVGTPCVTQTIVSPSPAQITVGPADLGTINGTVLDDDTTVLEVSIVAESATAVGILQNDAQLCIASRMAQGANVPLGQIMDLRLKGLGWGQIAKQKGLHAGMIGGGIHCDAAELADVREANGLGNSKNKGKGNGKGKGRGQA